MDTIQCQHCQTLFDGRFCPACGQEHVDTTRPSSLWNQVTESAEYGSRLVKTWATLFVRPEKVVKSFLAGDTKQFTTPIKYFLLIGGLGFILDFARYSEVLAGLLRLPDDWQSSMTPIIKSWHYFVLILVLSKFLLGGYNWTSHLLISCYVFAQLVFIAYVAFILQKFNENLILIGLISLPIYYLWFNVRVFSDSLWKTILKTLLIILVAAFVFFQEVAINKRNALKQESAAVIALFYLRRPGGSVAVILTRRHEGTKRRHK